MESSHLFTGIQHWQIAFIYAFISTFNPQCHLVSNYYKLPELLPEEIETEIQKEKSTAIDQYICSCLGNALNRKHPIESYNNALQQIITDKLKSYDVDLARNPVSNQKFHTLDITTKLYLLYCMIEWQLQDSHAVRSIIEIAYSNRAKNKYNPIKMTPIGTDSKKRNYWQFGESPYVWRDSIKVNELGQWETVCTNKTELEQLVESLSNKNRAEKQLIKYITDVLYEVADKAEKKKWRKERAEIRKAFVPEVSITPLQLRSRNKVKVNYNFDDIYESNEEDSDPFEEEKSDTTETPTKSVGTRWSSRLNNTDDGRWNELTPTIDTTTEDVDTNRTEGMEDGVIIVDEDSVMKEMTINVNYQQMKDEGTHFMDIGMDESVIPANNQSS
ncbi:hypothetical protein BDB01DRAFT_792933 [Pilobolus umbonatus]|nr:hypothetical protein BDB01DRAFT_792933 [Pilobolus umbonatus]